MNKFPSKSVKWKKIPHKTEWVIKSDSMGRIKEEEK